MRSIAQRGVDGSPAWALPSPRCLRSFATRVALQLTGALDGLEPETLKARFDAGEA